MEFLRVFCVFLLFGLAVSAEYRGCPTLSVKPCTCYDFEEGPYFECWRVTSTNDVRNAFVNSKGYTYHFVKFADTVIDYVPREIFEGVEIKKLEVSNGTLVSLFNEIPENLPNLIFFQIRNTHIESGFEWKVLQGMTNLRRLYIREVNEIKVLGEDFVQYAPKSLKLLTLRGTKTTQIIEGAFNQFPNLRTIWVENCPLKELNRNMFPVPFNGDNLGFRDNQLTSLPIDLFSDMPNLESVSFSGNSLTTIPPSHSKKLWFIDLKGNPLNCDCDLAWIATKKKFSGTCSSPEELKGKDLKDVYKSMRCL